MVGGAYYGVSAAIAEPQLPQYVLGSATKGTIISSLTGSGQVLVSDQVDVKPKTSGTIAKLLVTEGQSVTTNTIIAYLDTHDANKALRDARANYESARLSFEKFKQPATPAEIQQAENALASSRASLEKLKIAQVNALAKTTESQTKAHTSLTKSYDDAFTTVANAFLDLPSIVTSMEDAMFGTKIVTSESTAGSSIDNSAALYNSVDVSDRMLLTRYQSSAKMDVVEAQQRYEKSATVYKGITRYSSPEQINAALEETAESVRAVAQALKSEQNYFDAWVDMRTERGWVIWNTVTAYQNSIATSLGEVNAHLSTLTSAGRAIDDAQSSIAETERSLREMTQNNPLDIASAESAIRERESALSELRAGADPIDLRTQELALAQRWNSVVDAQEAVANAVVRAPFDGVIASVSQKVGDSASSGSAIATVITKQRMAQITLNEVDVAKVKIGQKVTVTFDALDTLTMSGTVASIDVLGTVTQGVVTYTVTVAFDTQDERIKPGMSVSASIILDRKGDVILAPISAIKSQGDVHYVEIVDAPIGTADGVAFTSSATPRRQNITTGIASDTEIEIVSGLGEGDRFISRTIAASTPVTQSAPSLFGAATGGNRSTGAGAAFRAIR